MIWKRLPLLLIALLVAVSAQAQTFNLDVRGAFTNNAPLTPYTSPSGTFSADFTVSGNLIYDSSGLYIPTGGTSVFSYSLNGSSAVALTGPNAFFNSLSYPVYFSGASARSDEGLDLSFSTQTPFFSGVFGGTGSLKPGTYTLSPYSEVNLVGNVGPASAPIASGTLTVNPVPEPSPLTLIGSGAALTAIGRFLRRRRR